ncbi:MAG: tripartite tricarboxylate transporter substrate binding protein [Thermoanaerobacteraceae bacterium]|nr:tripartite tricarboxylate transporter substrate binding protein [Thermoanaerobacteraceae bacterium]
MRRLISLTMIIAMVLLLCIGCSSGGSDTTKPNDSSNESVAIDFPGKKSITMIVPWSPGGGSDVGARLLQPYLEEKLGTPIVVTNPTGASGWIGWEQLLSADADGYSVALVNFPTLFSGYLDKSLGRDKTIDDFQLIANHVTDYCVIAARKDDTRFDDLKSFVEYAKENELTIASTGIGTDDHILIEQLKRQAGLKLTMVPGNGWSDSYAALLGGHVDVAAGNVGEVLVPQQEGELITLVVFSEERSKFLPDIPTWNESGLGGNIVCSSQRGFAVRAGTPQEIFDVLSEAFEYAITNQEGIDKLAEMGLDVDYIGPEEYTKHIKEEEQKLIDMAIW